MINVHVQPVAGQSPGALESSPPPVVHPFFCAVATVLVRTRVRVAHRINSLRERRFLAFLVRTILSTSGSAREVVAVDLVANL